MDADLISQSFALRGARHFERGFGKGFSHEREGLAEAAMWKRGASNGGYHYLGCAKTFALMGRAFADATLTMMKEQPGR